MRSPLLILLTLLCSALPLRAATVKTLDGRTHDGEIGLDTPGHLTIVPRGGAPLRIPLSNILLARFTGSEADAPEAEAPRERWSGRDIGKVAAPGSARLISGAMTIRAGGADMWGVADSGHFVYQVLNGDGQIVARVAAVQETNQRAKAGLMFRAGLEPNAVYAMALVHAGGGTFLQYRAKPGRGTAGLEGGGDGPPRWLRLARKENTFIAHHSRDGANWELIGSRTIPMPPNLMVGLAVCARNHSAVCTALFESISITHGTPRIDPGAASAGLLLRSGSFLAGDIRSVSDTAIRFQREREVTVAPAEVARILFSPLPGETERNIPPGRTGVVLANGDFFEGDIQRIEKDRVSVSSVLFGLRRFDIAQVSAIMLRESNPAAAQFEVRAADGSTFLTDRLAIEKQSVLLHERGVGEQRLAAESIVEIKAGPARFAWLSDLRPQRIDAPASAPRGGALVMDGTTAGVPMSLLGEPCQRGIGLAAGTTISYALDGSCRLLLLRAGVPDGILPTMGVRFVILGDGKELYRSAERTAVDEALEISLNIAGVRSLVISVQAGAFGEMGGSGLLGDPALVK